MMIFKKAVLDYQQYFQDDPSQEIIGITFNTSKSVIIEKLFKDHPEIIKALKAKNLL